MSKRKNRRRSPHAQANKGKRTKKKKTGRGRGYSGICGPTGKRIYHSRDQAESVVKHAVGDTPPARAYPCNRCGGWHLTSLSDPSKLRHE